MICKNFVCAFSHYERGKMYCDWDNTRTDCDVSRSMSCGRFKYLGCKYCGHDITCNQQREKGVFYSPDKGLYTPSYSAQFAETAQNNDLVNAKRDIYNTSCTNYKQGYKMSTTVNQLFDKYNKDFPQFTKDFLREAYCKSVMKYLETEE